MADTAPRRPSKKSVNVSIDADLVAEAKASGMNLSAALETALRQQMQALRETAWKAENKDAIEASNAHYEAHGLPLDKYRVW